MTESNKLSPRSSRFVLAILIPASLWSSSVFSQNPDGFIQSDQWLALGPFSLAGDFDCDAGEAALIRDYFAPSSIETMAPAEGDEIEYDTGVAATLSYNGPPGPSDRPVWRPFDDGVDDVLIPDDILDLNQDAFNVGSPEDYVTTLVVTYFSYLGAEPVDVDMCVGSDDSVQVWIDGDMVHNNNECRGHGMCDDNVAVTIAPGLHRIAMQVFDKGGQFAGSLGFKDKEGNFISDSDTDWVFLGMDRGGLVFPSAKIAVDVSSGPEPLTVQFDGSGSTSPGGAIAEYLWQFGDGESGRGAKVTHTYAKGSFQVARLFVTNNVKGVDSAEQLIAVTMSTQGAAPWLGADVGSPVLPGAERRQGSCLAVFGGGTAITETSDQFHFTHVEKTGDVTLTVQIDEALWKPGAIAGIMMRESLNPDSRFAFVNVQYYPGVGGLQYGLLSRKVPGARALASRGEVVPFTPHGYLRLERKANQFLSYTSPDGRSWTPLFSTIFGAMSETLLAGLAVSAGDSDAARQAARITFCNIDFGLTGSVFHRGDADDNGELQLTDAVRILSYLFLGQNEPSCIDAADADDNGVLQLTDAVRILGFLFLGQAAPAPPGPPGPGQACGADVNVEEPDLGCASYTHC